MRAWEIRDDWGIDQLTLVDRPVAPIPVGHVQLRMLAASLNYRDLLMIRGQYNPRQPFPLIPCSDGVGLVEAVGEGVDRVEVGDRVMPIFCPQWLSGPPVKSAMRATLGGPIDGVLAETMTVPQDGLVRVPEYLSNEAAACLPCAAVTAWNALVTYGDVKPGRTVLLQGTGGVSIFALQIAKILGARVIITSSKEHKLDRAEQLGADHVLNYVETPEWGKAVRQWAPEGVDLVVEVGGAGTLAQSLRAVRVGGQISLIGVLAGNAATLDLTAILMQHIRVQGILVGARSSFEAMLEAFAQHRIEPVIDQVFDFDAVPEAMRHMANAGHFGKIVVRIAE